jgi:hypothetical protein
MSTMNTMDDHDVIFAFNRKVDVRTYPEPHRGMRRDQYRMRCPYLHAGLRVHVDGKCMEVWVPRLGLYTELLADTEFQAGREGNELKGEKTKCQLTCWGLALGNPWLFRPSLPLRRDSSLVSSSAKFASPSLVFLS